MKDIKVVYHILYRLSVWVLAGFYAEVYVEGAENVPDDGPLILAANHPNEILDAAATAVTLPHKRIVSFWAKSTFFANPAARWFFESASAIPVHRNPNRDDGTSKAALFKSSSLALALNGALGVFPEGACYTEPTIVQIMSGTAWAAVEYERWQRKQQEEGKPVKGSVIVIPLALVFTEKATFDSSVRVQYGDPIRLSEYANELFTIPPDTNPDTIAYGVVKKITQRIEQHLFSMTINASDWETLYAAETLRAIVYKDERKILMKDWISVSQHFVDILSRPDPAEPLGRAKESLIKYYSLLQYTGLTHYHLQSFGAASTSTSLYISNLLLPSLSTILLLPLYIPTLVLHIPACIAGELNLALLSTKTEPEGFAQWRATGGGIGVGMAIAALLIKFSCNRLIWEQLGVPYASVSLLGRAATFITAAWVVARLYAPLAPGLHRRLRSALASYRVVVGLLSRRTSLDITPYTKIPPPLPSNAFIRRHGDTAKEYWDKREREVVRVAPPKIAGRKLIRALLRQREETEGIVREVWKLLGPAGMIHG